MTMYQWGQAALILVALVLLCWAPLERTFWGLGWRMYCWFKAIRLPKLPRLPKMPMKPKARWITIAYPASHDQDHKD